MLEENGKGAERKNGAGTEMVRKGRVGTGRMSLNRSMKGREGRMC